MTCRCINSGQSNFEFEYIGKFETEFNKFLEYESGAQVDLIDRKKLRAKISCYCPFKMVLYHERQASRFLFTSQFLNKMLFLRFSIEFESQSKM